MMHEPQTFISAGWEAGTSTARMSAVAAHLYRRNSSKLLPSPAVFSLNALAFSIISPFLFQRTAIRSTWPVHICQAHDLSPVQHIVAQVTLHDIVRSFLHLWDGLPLEDDALRVLV